MKTKLPMINRRGHVVGVVDDSGIVPDGYGIRVPMLLQDGVPITTHLQVTDAWGNEAGHRPGYCFNNGEVQAQDAYDAREAYKARLANAWKPNTAPLAVVADQYQRLDNPDAAHEAYKARISNAWRTKPR